MNGPCAECGHREGHYLDCVAPNYVSTSEGWQVMRPWRTFVQCMACDRSVSVDAVSCRHCGATFGKGR